MWRPLAPSIELSRILDATSRGTDAECDHWRSSPLGPPSLLGKGACLSLLVRCSLGRSWGSIELACYLEERLTSVIIGEVLLVVRLRS
jgi:hypothetical protein